MARPAEVIEYGWAYWITARRPGRDQPSTYFGALTTEAGGTVVTKPERQWLLAYENQLGRDGWLVWRYWDFVDNPLPLSDSVLWLKNKVRAAYPDVADLADGCFSVDSCRVRRILRADEQ